MIILGGQQCTRLCASGRTHADVTTCVHHCLTSYPRTHHVTISLAGLHPQGCGPRKRKASDPSPGDTMGSQVSKRARLPDQAGDLPSEGVLSIAMKEPLVKGIVHEARSMEADTPDASSDNGFMNVHREPSSWPRSAAISEVTTRLVCQGPVAGVKRKADKSIEDGTRLDRECKRKRTHTRLSIRHKSREIGTPWDWIILVLFMTTDHADEVVGVSMNRQESLRLPKKALRRGGALCSLRRFERYHPDKPAQAHSHQVVATHLLPAMHGAHHHLLLMCFQGGQPRCDIEAACAG